MKKFAIAVALLAAAGCGKKNDGDASKKTTEPEKTKEPEKTPDKPKEVAKTPDKPKETPAPAGVKIDPEIAKRVKAVVDNCTFDMDNKRFSDCKNNESDEIFQYALKNKSTTIFESMAEIALTDGAKDPKYLIAVSESWPQFSDRDIQKGASTPAASERVIKLFSVVNPGSERFSNAAAIPLLAGKRADLTAALIKLGDDRAELRRASFQQYLKFVGAEGLADLQAYYKSAKTDDDKIAAVGAVGYGIKDVPDADKAKLCDWAKEVAADTSLTPFALRGALDSLSRCGGAYIDAALTDIEASIKDKKLNRHTSEMLYHMCWAEGVVGGTVNGTKEQCAKAYTILENGFNDKDAPPAEMSGSLFAIEMLGKGEAGNMPKAKALLTKLSSNKDKNVADAAKGELKNLK